MNIRVLRTGDPVRMEGFFSILPATDLVPGNIVEVSVRRKVPTDKRMIEMLSNQVCVDQAILPGLASVKTYYICSRVCNLEFESLLPRSWTGRSRWEICRLQYVMNTSCCRAKTLNTLERISVIGDVSTVTFALMVHHKDCI